MADLQAVSEKTSFTLSSNNIKSLKLSGLHPNESLYDCISRHKESESRMKSWELSKMFLLDNYQHRGKGLLNMGLPIKFVSDGNLYADFCTRKALDASCLGRKIPGGASVKEVYVTKTTGDVLLLPEKLAQHKICVPFLPNETLLEALHKDGRFNRDKLGACEIKLDDTEHGKISNPHTTDASSYEGMAVEVSFDRRRSRDISEEVYQNFAERWYRDCQEITEVSTVKREGQNKEELADATPSTSQAGPPGDATVKEEEHNYEPTSKQKRIAQNMQEHVEEQNRRFQNVIELYIELLNSDKSGSRKPSDESSINKKFSPANKKDREKALSIAVENFRKDYKAHITSALLRKLNSIQEFVGVLLLPHPEHRNVNMSAGTALYLGPEYILTCWHVLQFIYGNDIKPGPLTPNTDYKVYFGDTFCDMSSGICGYMHKIIAGDSAEKNKLDYAIVKLVKGLVRGANVTEEMWEKFNSPKQEFLRFGFLGKTDGYESNKPTSDEDYSKQVHIIGWPDVLDNASNFVRQIDVGCTILPPTDDDYMSYLCFIHSKPASVETPKHKQHVHYKTNFLQGASGSPVVDLFGNVISMHRMGYPFNASKGNYKLEIGVLVEHIAKHLCASNVKDEQLSSLPVFDLFHQAKVEPQQRTEEIQNEGSSMDVSFSTP